MLKKIETLVQTQGLCVLSTCGPGIPLGEGQGGDCNAPHASLMSYCAAADCSEFWLATHTATRKYRNLSANPCASLLIDDRCAAGAALGLALTVAARCAPFATPQNEAAARRLLLEKHPQLASFLDSEGVVLLRLRVESLQLLSGLTDLFFISAEKMLDAWPRTA